MLSKFFSVLWPAFFLLSGCARWLAPPPSSKSTLLFAGNASQCFSGFKQNLTAFFNAAEAVDKLQANLECTARALDLFQSRTRFHREGIWTAEEIADFLQEEFHLAEDSQSGSVSTAFLLEILKLKSSVLGGSSEEISKIEILKIKQMILNISTVLPDIERNRFFLFNQLTTSQADEELLFQAEQSQEVLHRLVANLSEQFDSGGGAYSVDDLSKLLASSPWHVDIANYLPLIRSMRNIFLPPDQDKNKQEVVLATQWPELLTLVSDLFIDKQKYSIFIADKGPSEKRFQVGVLALRNSLLTQLERAIQKRGPGKVIPIELFTNLLRESYQLGLNPFSIRLQSFELFLPAVFTKFLRSAGGIGDSEQVGLGYPQLLRLTEKIDEWLEIQQKIKSDLSLQLLKETNSNGENQTFTNLFALGRPLVWAGPYLAFGRTRQLQTQQELSSTVTYDWLARWILQSYAHDPERSRRTLGITSDETQEFYLDVRSIGIDLGYMDQRSRNSGSRSFLEATLFTSVGDGKNILTARMASEFFAMLISGGHREYTFYQLARQVCEVAETDVFGRKKMDTQCFFKLLQTHWREAADWMPGWQNEMHLADEKKWSELNVALQNAARNRGAQVAPMEEAEARVIFPVLQYAESLAERFAGPHGELGEKEIWSAFPTFEDFIFKLSSGRADTLWKRKAVFIYLIALGHPPHGDFWDSVKMLYWYSLAKTNLVHLALDRVSLVKLISSIGIFSRENEIAELRKFVATKGSVAEFKTWMSQQKKDDPETLELLQLAKCPKELGSHFSNLLHERAKSFFPTKTEGESFADSFGVQMFEWIEAKPELARNCLPYL